jgi:3-oxoacyl-(acyl-carrier-protein) synthase
MGAITPVGEDVAALWQALRSGRSGIHRLAWADERLYPRIGGDLAGWDLARHLDTVGAAYPPETVHRARRLLRTTPPPGQLGAAVALQALADAGWPELDPLRFGHVMAGHNTNLSYVAHNVRLLDEDPDSIEPLSGLHMLDTDPLAVVSELVGARGPTLLVGNACASGNMALQVALDLLRSDRADAVLVSGSGFDLEPLMLQAWAVIDALSLRSFNDEPERASRPFDRLREGFVPSRMAGAILLERAEVAQARGAPAHALLLGAASASDACRLTRPDLDGQVRTMRLALADAGLDPSEVDYVNAHATSTPLGDRVEVAAIKTVFGRRAARIPVNGTKSILGHGLIATAVVEAIATVLQLRHATLHPTINQEVPDPELDLDFVPNQCRAQRIERALSNSFGFGGLNACVLLGRP